jgi:hypothetical protein
MHSVEPRQIDSPVGRTTVHRAGSNRFDGRERADGRYSEVAQQDGLARPVWAEPWSTLVLEMNAPRMRAEHFIALTEERMLPPHDAARQCHGVAQDPLDGRPRF